MNVVIIASIFDKLEALEAWAQNRGVGKISQNIEGKKILMLRNMGPPDVDSLKEKLRSEGFDFNEETMTATKRIKEEGESEDAKRGKAAA